MEGAMGWGGLNRDVKEHICTYLTLVQLAKIAPTCRDMRALFHARREPLTTQLLSAGCESYGQSVFHAVALCMLRFTCGLDPYSGLPLPQRSTWGPHGPPPASRVPCSRGGKSDEQVMCIERSGKLSRTDDWPAGGKVDVTWTPGNELRFLFIFPDGRRESPLSWRPLLAMRVTPVGYARRAYALQVVANQHCRDVLGAILAVCLEMEKEILACPGEWGAPLVESLQYRLPLWACDSPAEHELLVATIVPLVGMFDTWRTEVVTDEPTTFVRWTLTGTRTRDPRPPRVVVWEAGLSVRGFMAWLVMAIVTWLSAALRGY